MAKQPSSHQTIYIGDNHFDHHPTTVKHEHEIELDKNVLERLPEGSKLKSAKGFGASNWNLTGRIIFEDKHGKEQSYYVKIGAGAVAEAMFRGENESMQALYDAIPQHVPKPLAWGAVQDGRSYFQLFGFHNLDSSKPSISAFTEAVAALHKSRTSPTGRFGFQLTTYNGNLPQDNTWTDTWEEFYANGMRRMMALDAEARGSSTELTKLQGPFFEKVIPRLLRPLEVRGRKVEPVLLHGDLWIGNAATDRDTGRPILFDSSAFYGHHEYDLSPMYLMNSPWGRECLETYHQYVPKSEPVVDWEARTALYALREQFHDSNLFPDVPYFRESCITMMRKLVEAFPNGYEAS